jgi:hypothetical protein
MTAGDYFIQSTMYTPQPRPARFYVKSITWQGRDLLREPVKVGEGTVVEGVQVVLSAQAAVLNVRVLSAAKRPTPGIAVILVPAASGNWSVYAQTNHCLSGADGNCEVAAAPGEYAVVAVSLRQTQTSDYEQEVRRLVAAAPRVTLSLGEPQKLDLTLPAPR